MDQPLQLTFAVCLLVLGLSYLLGTAHWVSFLRDAFQTPRRLFPLALAMLAGGASIGSFYNDWSATWPIFMTAFGWLMAAEGALILLFPGYLKKMEKLPEGFLRGYLRFGGLLFVGLGVLMLRAA